jgi:hypothetical protein
MVRTIIAIFRNHQNKGQILSGTALKVIALGLMVIDHLYEFFYTQGVPAWFNWFGRPVATLFIFLCAEGFYYTKSRKRYMLHLLTGFLLMTALSMGFSHFMRLESVVLINNIFGTLFVATFYMLMIDLFRKSMNPLKRGNLLLALGGMLLPLLMGFGILVIISQNLLSWSLTRFLLFIPNPIIAEGGFVLVFMGVLFYILRKFRLAQVGVVLVISILSALNTQDAQWLMVTAIVPMLLYNGRRGLGGKYFFYIFYPAHIYIFYITAWLIQRGV